MVPTLLRFIGETLPPSTCKNNRKERELTALRRTFIVHYFHKDGVKKETLSPVASRLIIFGPAKPKCSNLIRRKWQNDAQAKFTSDRKMIM